MSRKEYYDTVEDIWLNSESPAEAQFKLIVFIGWEILSSLKSIDSATWDTAAHSESTYRAVR